MYKGISSEEFKNFKDVIATYLLQELPTDSFAKAVIDSEPELIEELTEFSAYDTMARDITFDACANFLLKMPHPCNSGASAAIIEEFDRNLKKAYVEWVAKETA